MARVVTVAETNLRSTSRHHSYSRAQKKIAQEQAEEASAAAAVVRPDAAGRASVAERARRSEPVALACE